MISIQLDLGNHLEGFVKKQIESGYYLSENEVLKDALSNLEKKKSLEMLDKAIREGVNSGPFTPLDFEDFLIEMNKKEQ